VNEPEGIDTTKEPIKEELADDSLDNVVGGVAYMGVLPPR
jgi:hypothetical protein